MSDDQQTRSAALLENLGDLESWKGNPEKATSYLDEALRLYQEQADTKGIASVLQKQGAAARRYSDWDKAIAKATAALEYFRDLDDSLGIADASALLGASFFMREQDDEALALLREALEIYRTHGNDVGTALCLERIGELQRCKSQEDEALSTLEEAVAVASRSGDQLGVARAFGCMAAVHLERGDFERAVEACSKGRPIAQNIGWYGGLSDIDHRMGIINMELGDYREAEAFFQDSVSTARQGRARWELACALKELGDCFRKQSKLDEAVSALGEAWLLHQELEQSEDAMQIASALAEVKSSQGDWDGALVHHDHNIAMYRGRKNHWNVTVHLEEKAQILVKARRYDEAALHFEAAIVTCVENGYSWNWELGRLCAIPKMAMKWERRLPLLCDLRKLQQRQPQLKTPNLKFPLRSNSGKP